jgi:hypothetical protein
MSKMVVDNNVSVLEVKDDRGVVRGKAYQIISPVEVTTISGDRLSEIQIRDAFGNLLHSDTRITYTNGGIK